jgi:hypothetical protein
MALAPSVNWRNSRKAPTCIVASSENRGAARRSSAAQSPSSAAASPASGPEMSPAPAGLSALIAALRLAPISANADSKDCSTRMNMYSS